jgi:hypothetical protein
MDKFVASRSWSFFNVKNSLFFRWLNNSLSASLEAESSNKFSHPSAKASGCPKKQQIFDEKMTSRFEPTNLSMSDKDVSLFLSLYYKFED